MPAPARVRQKGLLLPGRQRLAAELQMPAPARVRQKGLLLPGRQRLAAELQMPAPARVRQTGFAIRGNPVWPHPPEFGRRTWGR